MSEAATAKWSYGKCLVKGPDGKFHVSKDPEACPPKKGDTAKEKPADAPSFDASRLKAPLAIGAVIGAARGGLQAWAHDSGREDLPRRFDALSRGTLDRLQDVGGSFLSYAGSMLYSTATRSAATGALGLVILGSIYAAKKGWNAYKKRKGTVKEAEESAAEKEMQLKFSQKVGENMARKLTNAFSKDEMAAAAKNPKGAAAKKVAAFVDAEVAAFAKKAAKA